MQKERVAALREDLVLELPDAIAYRVYNIQKFVIKIASRMTTLR